MLNTERGSLHQRVTDDLLERIGRGEFPPGNPLPTEMALCDHYGVSRITVRHAISALVDRGIILRKRGVGSFVSGRARGPREFNLIGFMDDSRVFTNSIELDLPETADAEIAAALALEPGAAIRHIRAVGHRDGEQLTVVDAYSSDAPEKRVSVEDFHASIPSAHAMARRIGRRVERAEQELDAVIATPEDARLLGVTPGRPIMRTRRVYFSVTGQRVNYMVIRYHPDRYRFNIDLVINSAAAVFEKTTQG